MLSDATAVSILPIKNLDRALKFYTGALGGKLKMRGEGEMKDSWASVGLAGSEYWLTVPDKREKLALAYNCFTVKDIKKSVAALSRKGVRFLPGEKMGRGSRVEGAVTVLPWGAKSAFFKDTEGNLLMLWEQMTP
jgi:catechol 2,3-dioxygenase-like lactoylglutathione lyase family enzyme